MQTQRDDDAFDHARPMLLGLAYRILGSHADAEDAVQDTFLKWRAADAAAVDNPDAWLTTACTRRCIDLLRSAHRARTEYVGTWLPEPVLTLDDATPEHQAALASSLTTAFLLLLERLTPKERAAYLLHEIFDRPYPEIARTLDMQEAACRKLVSRAHARVGEARARRLTPPDQQQRLLRAFHAAVSSGDTTSLASMLSGDIQLCADGGGKVPTLERVLHGADEVLGFIRGSLHGYWRQYRWRIAAINRGPGAVLMDGEEVAASVSFACDDGGRVCGIYIVRNPDKLARLARTAMV